MKYYTLKLNHEFTYVLCGMLKSENFVHMERSIDINVLIIVETGTLNIEINGTKYKVRKGEMIILPPNYLHKGFIDEDTKEKIKYFWVHFYTNSPFELSDFPVDFCVPLHFKLNNFARVNILYNQLLDGSKLSNTRKKYCNFLLTALFCEISAQYSSHNVCSNKIVNQTVSWIELNITSPISLENVSQHIGYNKKYLSKIFKENIGMTINQFIMDKKMLLAKQFLCTGYISITEIAHQLGFCDSAYFMRCFKKHEGITCGEYRNAYSKMFVNTK